MKITVNRRWFTPESTISDLLLDGKWECFVLEDRQRAAGVKVQNETAIPLGKYSVIVDYSPHFKKYMPHILNVPMFDGVRIHSGNTAADTEGCLVVGSHREENRVYGGRLAMPLLFSKLAEEVDYDAEHDCTQFRIKEPTTIEIVDASPAPDLDGEIAT